MCLVGVVVRKYIDFLILLIPSSLLSALFCSSIPTFCSFLNIIIYIHNVNIIVSMAHIWYVFSFNNYYYCYKKCTLSITT